MIGLENLSLAGGKEPSRSGKMKKVKERESAKNQILEVDFIKIATSHEAHLPIIEAAAAAERSLCASHGQGVSH